MPTESARIADLLERAYRGEAWHGPSLTEALTGVDADMAIRRLEPGVHSIWELVSHVLAWGEEVSRRLAGEQPREMTESLDWPKEAARSEDAWAELRERLDESHRRLVARVTELSDARLDDDLQLASPSKIYLVLHGVIHHHLYHAGQIQMLKRVFERKT